MFELRQDNREISHIRMNQWIERKNLFDLIGASVNEWCIEIDSIFVVEMVDEISVELLTVTGIIIRSLEFSCMLKPKFSE